MKRAAYGSCTGSRGVQEGDESRAFGRLRRLLEELIVVLSYLVRGYGA